MRTLDSYYGASGDSPAYSSGDIARIINNTATDNLNWGLQQVNDNIRYLVTKYYFDERSYTDTTGSQKQFYNLPPQVKKLIDVTLTIGGVVWTPQVCPSREMWDKLNVIPIYQDYPSYFFVYNGQVGFFPIPSTAGNTITMNYKTRTIDLDSNIPDVTDSTSSQTVSTDGTTTITASGSVFRDWMVNQWIRIPFSSTDSNNGDNQWYQIDSVTSGTTLVLKNKYTGADVAAGGFRVGQVPILPEDYQDLPLYRMGILYYTTRYPDPIRAQEYQALWDQGIAALDDEFGSKTQNVILPDTDIPQINPNLYVTSVSQN